jgi:hypothetical protein
MSSNFSEAQAIAQASPLFGLWDAAEQSGSVHYLTRILARSKASIRISGKGLRTLPKPCPGQEVSR